jgi:hypothetical protein
MIAQTVAPIDRFTCQRILRAARAGAPRFTPAVLRAIDAACDAESFPRSYTAAAREVSERMIVAAGRLADEATLVPIAAEIHDLRNGQGWYR